jgi:hypothetical protein
MKTIYQCFLLVRAVGLALLLFKTITANAQFTFVTNNGTITITGTSVTYIGGVALIIPSTTNGFPVTSIGPGAFQYYNMTSLFVPDGVTNIGNLACYNCSGLTNLALGKTVQSIGSSAFNSCVALKNAVLPDSLTSLGATAFAGCTNLTNCLLGNGLTVIPTQTFQGCTGLKNILIPNGVTFIDQEAFEDTGLTRINIPDSVTNIERYAFDNTASLTNVVVGGGVQTMGVSAFNNYKGITVNFYFKGSPPSLGGTPVPNAKIFYLPGATGWGTNFGGFPTVLWNPQAQTADGQFGVRSNRFGFNITGTTNIPVVVEVSTNLASSIWTPVQSVNLTNGSYYFSDPFSKTNGLAGRFYRIRSP